MKYKKSTFSNYIVVGHEFVYDKFVLLFIKK
jgi:hypothetical protein